MKRFNLEHLIKFIVLMGLSIYLFYLLTTGKIYSYIHPKRINMMWFANGSLILLVLYQFSRIFTIPSRTLHFKKYISLFFLLLCGIFPLLSTKEQNSPAAPPKNNMLLSTTNENTIFLDKQNYAHTLSLFETEPESFVGQKVIAEGFIYRDEAFSMENFMVARKHMLCCAADVQVMGLMCEINGANTLQENEWVRVEGILQIKSHEENGQTEAIPFLEITRITKIPEPEYPYVY